MHDPELVRTLHIRPYTPGNEWFRVEIYDANETDNRGAPVILWKLFEHRKGHAPLVIFDGVREPRKWRCSGWFSVDGNEAAELVLTFASLKPGDTDREFFDDYSKAQLEWAQAHGEAISCENERRFRRQAA